MKDPLLQLTSAIATRLFTMTSKKSEFQGPLADLLQAAQLARHQAYIPSEHGYAGLVAEALSNAQAPGVTDIADALMTVFRELPWVYHYAHAADDDLSARIAFAELIGPDGPLIAPDSRVGFTVMAKQTQYPTHCHPAVELYWVITGNARWCTPTSDRMVPSGELVLHRSNEPHAMQTFEEPLLALWGWTGNIDAPAVYLPTAEHV